MAGDRSPGFVRNRNRNPPRHAAGSSRQRQDKAQFCIRGLPTIPFSAPFNLSKELPVFQFKPQNRFYAREHRIGALFAGILGRPRIPSSWALNSMPSACDRSLLSLKFKEKCMNPRTQPAQALCPTPSQYRRLAEVKNSALMMKATRMIHMELG